MTQINTRIEPLRDGAFLHILRNGKPETRLRMGPNHVHAFIERRDGSVEDLGSSCNLLTNTGRDLWAAAFGQAANVSGANSSASSATSLTTSGLTADQFKGWRVFVPVTGVTTPPVYGNVGKNTTTVITVDQWWNAADATGTTPAAASAWMATPTCLPRFMGLTTDSAAAVATDTVLATEILSGAGTGCGRARATYAHTAATATYTMQVIFTVAGAGHTAIHKMGLFSSNMIGGVAADSGIMVFETVLNLDATVGAADTLTVTDTITLSG
jgi:hypothetical protein